MCTSVVWLSHPCIYKTLCFRNLSITPSYRFVENTWWWCVPLLLLTTTRRRLSSRTVLAMEISSFHILKAFTCMHVAEINARRYAYSNCSGGNIKNVQSRLLFWEMIISRIYIIYIFELYVDDGISFAGKLFKASLPLVAHQHFSPVCGRFVTNALAVAVADLQAIIILNITPAKFWPSLYWILCT